jgi:hypothetical protein
MFFVSLKVKNLCVKVYYWLGILDIFIKQVKMALFYYVDTSCKLFFYTIKDVFCLGSASGLICDSFLNLPNSLLNYT